MALICRMKELKSSNFFNNFKRFYFQIHNHHLITNYTSPTSISDCFASKNQANFRRGGGFFDYWVRFYAAPVQVGKKNEDEKKLNRPRMNDEITYQFLRLVTDEGHSVVSRREAQQRAKELNLDLVEVDSQAKPPVCRIMDYSRAMYKRQVKAKEKAKIKSAGSLKSSAIKEVRFSVKAELKDMKTKADNVKRLIERGYRVKCMALASEGRDLNALLSQVSALIEDVALVELGPKVDGKQGYFIVRHMKFGQPKKGSKASTVSSATNSNSESQAKSSACSDGPVDSEEQIHAGESDTDSEDKESYLDLQDEVKTPLQGQGGKSWSRSNESKGTCISHDKQKSFDSQSSSTIKNDASTFRHCQTPDSVPNTGPTPQPVNRYARKVPNNAPPVRHPNNVASPPSRNSWPRNNENIQDTPNGAREPGNNFPPRAGPPRPPSFTGNGPSKSTSFGPFSGVKSDEGNSKSGVFLGNTNNPPTSKPDGSVAGDNKKWGIFSGANSASGRKV